MSNPGNTDRQTESRRSKLAWRRVVVVIAMMMIIMDYDDDGGQDDFGPWDDGRIVEIGWTGQVSWL